MLSPSRKVAPSKIRAFFTKRSHASRFSSDIESSQEAVRQVRFRPLLVALESVRLITSTALPSNVALIRGPNIRNRAALRLRYSWKATVEISETCLARALPAAKKVRLVTNCSLGSSAVSGSGGNSNELRD